MELMRPTCFASDNVCGMSKRGLERKKERTSLVIWIEVDVAVHDLVKEGLGILRASVMTYLVDDFAGPPSESRWTW